MNAIIRHLLCLSLISAPLHLSADEGNKTKNPELPPLELGFVDLFNGKDLTNWVDVNTSPETWSVKTDSSFVPVNPSV